MKKILALSTICILVLVACSAPAPPPPAPENVPPPEPTPEELAAKIRPALQPLEAVLAQGKTAAGKSFGLSDDMRNKVVEDLKQAKQSNQGTDNGKEALKMVSHDLEEIAHKARDQERFALVLGAIAGLEVLGPIGETTTRLKERAELEVTTPRVELTGFFDDKATNETYAFLRVTLKPSEELKEVRVRKGEEFCNCRFVDFMGDKKGIIVEYLKIPGKTWEVAVP